MPPPDPPRTLVVRVWLPDRPGALGQVASRIGAVHGDVTAIDILERGGGRVIDELVVAVPESVSVDLLAKEIGAVDGVAVEHIRAVGRRAARTRRPPCCSSPPTSPRRHRPSGWPRWSAGLLLRGRRRLGGRRARLTSSIEQRGTPPDLGWLLAFLDGSEHLDPGLPGRTRPAT